MYVFLGLFKDDIAQVDYVDAAQNVVSLKLLPRIDYTRYRGALRDKGVSPATILPTFITCFTQIPDRKRTSLYYHPNYDHIVVHLDMFPI